WYDPDTWRQVPRVPVRTTWDSVPSYQRLLLDVVARNFIRHHVCAARTPPVLHESGERLGRRFVPLFARSVGAASEIGELVDVAALRRPADGVVDQRDVLCRLDAMRLKEIACECRVVVLSLALVAALGSAISGPCGLRLRGTLHRYAIREPCLEDVGYLFARFRDHSAAQCLATTLGDDQRIVQIHVGHDVELVLQPITLDGC